MLGLLGLLGLLGRSHEHVPGLGGTAHMPLQAALEQVFLLVHAPERPAASEMERGSRTEATTCKHVIKSSLSWQEASPGVRRACSPHDSHARAIKF